MKFVLIDVFFGNCSMLIDECVWMLVLLSIVYNMLDVLLVILFCIVKLGVLCMYMVMCGIVVIVLSVL